MPRFLTLLLCPLLLIATASHADVKLLTSIKPLQLIAAAVQDGVGTPDNLLPPGASPHAYAMRPSDIRALQSADLFYWIGPDMEVFLQAPLNGRDKPTVAVQQLEGLQLRRFADFSGHGHDDDEAEHGDEHEHDHAHRPGSIDAHLWLLPANAQVVAARMAADLQRLDPANAARYARNLQAFQQRLTALDSELKQRLQPLAGKPYFVFHEAFDYFEQAYGLRHTGVFALSPQAQPGARHVAAMRERLQQVGPTCIFTEPPLQPRLAQTLSDGLPVTLAQLDALGSTQKVDDRGYEGLLRSLAAGLGDCLGKLPAGA